MIPPAKYYRRKVRNALQTALLFALMAALLGAIGYIMSGPFGLVVALVFALAIMAMSPAVSPRMVLKMYRARALSEYEAPYLYRVIEELARRADLPAAPVLYYVPSSIMNAFSVGDRTNAGIALTDGLIRALNPRELAGVLAHELSHVRHGDLWIMNLADSLSRFTNVFSTVGIFVLVVSLPLYLAAGVMVPLPALAVLMGAPTLAVLLQLALSRTREFEADLGAVALTGDPRGLASALGKIERYPMRLWDMILMPGRKVPGPSALRTHPETEKRIARLLELAEETQRHIEHVRDATVLPERYPPVTRAPRWRSGGIWH
ncbi:MAG TPA: zinc metalloprotease HtpX [Spirochaetota bacterium]|nr:zinc metalloprotease HtpX [Spirochaetota bacterium]HNT12719.1 zinc metalloprotease HtpX [Spirochaetota bacterium]HNV45756.1 zinc metalloprotease HtpX [Spirochaetota bacterium]HOS38148.1 zinc metalloprotease HtpX [Spirochaetota bacterium]HPI23750.1 zinc metalloprotease HtpX [Spirochaetota bacterium]